MSNTSSNSQESMSCNVCHHRWQRQTDTRECPACRSESTETVREFPISPASWTPLTERQITPADDLRHIHSLQEPGTASGVDVHPPSGPNPVATAAPARCPDQEMTDAPQTTQESGSGNSNQNTGNTSNPSGGSHGPVPPIVFISPPPAITFFATIVTDHIPPPGTAGPRGPSVVHLGMNYNPVPHVIPVPPTVTTRNSGAETNDTAQDDTQTSQQEQQRQQPQ